VNPGAISGFVWNDANGSYDRQANEPGFEGVYLFLYEGECDGRGRLPVNSAVTDSSGDYGMAYILPGVYCLILDESTLPPAAYGWANTTPGESYITIELGEGDKIEINFGYQVIIG
jgi:hypothetical protein